MRTLNSQRLAYGETLIELGKENPNIVVLEADLGKSTMSNMFQQVFPERYFEMGISEQDMLSTAAGLAASGKIAFVSSFAVFATGRAFDQIRQSISIGRLNVKICGSSSGLTDFGDGSTHQSVEDVAIMSAIPGMTVLTPCDANEAKAAFRAAAAIEGPVYIRVLRCNLPDFTDENTPFKVGVPNVLREGSDAMILAYGEMVGAAMDSAEELEKCGISASVVNVGTMKPFNYDMVAKLASGVKAVVTAEGHNFIGGLAGQTALALRKSSVPMDYVAINDIFGQSAYSETELHEYYGLTKENIAARVKQLLGKA